MEAQSFPGQKVSHSGAIIFLEKPDASVLTKKEERAWLDVH